MIVTLRINTHTFHLKLKLKRVRHHNISCLWKTFEIGMKICNIYNKFMNHIYKAHCTTYLLSILYVHQNKYIYELKIKME